MMMVLYKTEISEVSLIIQWMKGCRNKGQVILCSTHDWGMYNIYLHLDFSSYSSRGQNHLPGHPPNF